VAVLDVLFSWEQDFNSVLCKRIVRERFIHVFQKCRFQTSDRARLKSDCS
jgi:hypothetical protein